MIKSWPTNEQPLDTATLSGLVSLAIDEDEISNADMRCLHGARSPSRRGRCWSETSLGGCLAPMKDIARTKGGNERYKPRRTSTFFQILLLQLSKQPRDVLLILKLQCNFHPQVSKKSFPTSREAKLHQTTPVTSLYSTIFRTLRSKPLSSSSRNSQRNNQALARSVPATGNSPSCYSLGCHSPLPLSLPR